MKKGLLGTTALVGASIAMMGVAEAAKPKVSVKGDFAFYAGFTDQDREGLSSASGAINSVATDRGYATNTDSEIKFRAQSKTDAGMKWRATLELETDGSAGGGTVARRVADDSHLRLWGSWGMLMLGSIDGAGDKMSFTNNKYAYGTGGSGGKWQRFVNRKSVSTRFTGSPKGRDSGDSNKIVYYTPRMSGFQVGYSWSADRGDEGAQRSGDTSSSTMSADENDFHEVGVNYTGKHSGVSVKASYTGFFSDNEDDLEEGTEAHGFHAILGYGGFKVGGMYVDNTDSREDKTNSNDDAHSWDLGIAYGKGPYGVSYTYYRSEVENGSSGEHEQEIHVIGATYKLAKGVSVVADYFHYDSDEQGDTGSDNEADVIVLGIRTKW